MLFLYVDSFHVKFFFIDFLMMTAFTLTNTNRCAPKQIFNKFFLMNIFQTILKDMEKLRCILLCCCVYLIFKALYIKLWVNIPPC